MNNPGFKIKLKGYDREAVDAYIRFLLQELENKTLLIQNYEKQAKQLSEQLATMQTQYDLMRQKLEEASVSRRSLKEANLIIDTAQNNADMIVKEALITARILLVEVARISKELGLAKEDIKDKLKGMEQVINSIDIDEPPNTAWLAELK